MHSKVKLMGTLLQDFRYGLRMLRKNPGFTAVAVLTLALGIGANTALFSVVNGVLLNPLPYPEPEQLVTLHASKPNFERGSISYPNFRDWQRDNQVFSSIAIHRGYDFTLTGAGDAERVQGEFISSDFFHVLGVNPVVGRTFAPGEDEIGAAPVALISAGIWKRKFGYAEDVLGKSLRLDGRGYTIIGVIPASFHLSLRNFAAGDVYVPIGQWSNPFLMRRDAGLAIHGIGRLKPGVTIKQARGNMDRVTRNLAAAYPDVDKGVGASVDPMKDSVVGSIRSLLLVLWGAVGFVLLIACVNLANLLLARATGRSRELAIRVALGAGQRRLVSQLLTESVLLAAAGGGLGLLVAGWTMKGVLAALPAALPRAKEISLDGRVLAFTLVISLLAGILFGLVPALKSMRPEFHETLKESGRGLSVARHRAQGAFVVVETAMALVLLIGAGLMIRSLVALWSVSPGFDPRNVLVFSVSLPPSMITASPAAVRANLRVVHQEFESVLGIRAVSLSWAALPMAGEDDCLFWLEDEPKPSSPNDKHWTLSYVVEPDYLEAMGIPLRRGRFFTAQDDENAPRAVVIDDVFARRYFPNEDPVGKHLNLDCAGSSGVKAEIVGVVGHVKQWGLDSDDSHALRAQLYSPYMQLPDSGMALSPAGTTVVARFEGAVSAVTSGIRRSSRKMSGDQVVYGFQTMEEIISDTLVARRFSMILLGVFAALALVLSSVGIYGVVSYLVGQRTHEIGIRMALGAQRKHVLWLVVRQGVVVTLIGIGIGLVGALVLTRSLIRLLYDVRPVDPLTFVATSLLLTSVAFLASYIPARRATKVDPMVALRYE